MKNNKRLLYTICGFIGGMTGAFTGELVPYGAGLAYILIHTLVWSALGAAFLTVGLFAAGEIYNRKPFTPAVYRKGLFSGLIAGAIAGFIAQAVYSCGSGPSFFSNVIVRSLCWGLMGALLGWRLSTVVPNLGSSRGILAGAIGGFIGGIGFIITSCLLPEFLGRIVGWGILGAALGLAVVAIEEMFRTARLDVVWTPKEITTITLGSNPVYIGGGDDHIFVAGLPQHALGVILENGKVQCIDSASGKRSDLKEGSRIKIGKVEVIVRTKGQE